MRKYFLAAGITACAFALTFAIRGAFEQNIFSFFTCAVAVTAYLCGTRPALLSTLAAVVCTAFALMEPIGDWRVRAASDIARLIAFAVTSVLIISIVKRLRRTQQHLQATLADLDYVKTARGVWNWQYDMTWDRVMWSNYIDGMEVRQERNFRGWLDLVHPDDRARVEETVRAALENGILELQYRFRVSATTTVKFLTRAKVVRRHSSDTKRLVGLCMEATEAPPRREKLIVTRM